MPRVTQRASMDDLDDQAAVMLCSGDVPVKRRTIKRHIDGTVETYDHQSGTVRTEYLDGTVTTLHPCGRVEKDLDELTVDGETGSRLQTIRNKLSFTKEIAASDQEKRRRIIRGRRAGPSLPSNVARRSAEAGRDEDDDRPDVLMYGGQNVLPEMQEELAKKARRCELGMRLGSEKLLHDERDLEEPNYLKHFVGSSLATDWAAPELDVEEEERGWRNEYYKEQSNPDRLSDRENLLQEFKFRKRSKRTEVEDEVWRSEKAQREDAFSARLEQLKADLAEEKARAAKRDAKLRAREDRLAREQKEVLAALRKLEEEEDVENRVYPDCVPAFLMDRPQFYFYPKLARNKRVLAEAQQRVVFVEGPSKSAESDEEEIQIVQAPPDPVYVK